MSDEHRRQITTNRRTYLSLAATSALTSVAGCLGVIGGGSEGPKKGDDLPADPDPQDGYPPEFENQPEEREIDTSSYDTTTESGVDVPLAPIEDVYYWYARGEARFVDARGQSQYQQSHVYGAVLSPAPNGYDGDPVADWPTGERIVAYCGCPHHLSSMRASTLLQKGYEEVYVIDEGYREWYANNYPIAGAEVNFLPALQIIEGRTDPAYAGEKAWARHHESGQREVAPIAEDGSYELHLSFYDVTDSSLIALETPAYALEAPLGELTAELVTG